jgi:hypothetical protein
MPSGAQPSEFAVKHLIGVGLILAAAFALRFWFKPNGGLTYWSNETPTRFISFNTLGFWTLLAAACAWLLWAGTTLIVRRLR